MMRMISSMSAGQAKKYFTENLAKADYYLADAGPERQGVFKGVLAERLGISGPATRDAFFALCENRHPKTGQSLTPRTKEERLVGFDINWHCPKGVSLVHALSSDDHIVNAFQECVTETMMDIEREIATRIRTGGVYDDRQTSNLAWCEFVHETARPTPGHLPDPHLHIHAFAFNATHDHQENRVKAAKWRQIKTDAPFFQQLFHKRFSDKLIDLGYQIDRTDQAWDLAGVPKAVTEHFSKRHDEIGRAAVKLGMNTSKGRNALGALTRSKKMKGLTLAELKADWRRQIIELGRNSDTDSPVRYAPKKEIERMTASQCLQHAIDHAFERASVVDERKILRAAYRHALGHRDVSIEDINQLFAQDDRLIRIDRGSRTLVTTKIILQEEKRMVELARAGIGKRVPLYRGIPRFEKLKDQSAVAATHVLTTPNAVSIVMGAAGSGKTTMMVEMRDKIEAVGIQVFAFAPTAEAVRVLKEEGFENADTLARLLIDKDLQNKVKGQVILLDEAGLAGTKEMTGVLTVANEKNARLILCGDTRQHSSVLRGDALRVLNTVGGIKAAEVSKIYRQKNVQYREAVQDLAKGNIKEAFGKLDDIGAIKEIDPLNPNTVLVEDYVSAVKKGKSALVISPTHKQGDEVTAAIREKLKEAGMIGKTELSARKLDNLNLTQAEKADWRNYREGQAIQFNQHVKGFRRASKWTVKEATERGIKIKDQDGRTAYVPRHKAGHFDVYRASEISLSKGDRVRITRNGFDQDKKRLNNGMSLEVVSVKNGKIVLRNKISKATYALDPNYGHVAHAHVLTSYASQGKTVDQVFISQPSGTFAATDAKQFYVSVSRGKQAVTIYTDDKAALLDHASEAGDRQSALELVSSQTNHEKHMQHREHLSYEPKPKGRDKAHSLDPIKERGYEPEL